MLVEVSNCRPKKITFAMRKIWNGATYSLRVPLVQASVFPRAAQQAPRGVQHAGVDAGQGVQQLLGDAAQG